jgi:hypothetical protein
MTAISTTANGEFADRQLSADTEPSLAALYARYRPGFHLRAAAAFLSTSSNPCREGPPLVKCDQSSRLVSLSADELVFQIEVVSNLVVN